jgi:hypothetical protein
MYIYRYIDMIWIIYLSIYLSINLSIHQSINLSICLSIYLSINLSIHQSINISICLSIYLSINLSICQSINLSICLSIYLSSYLSIYFYVHIHRSIVYVRFYIFYLKQSIAGNSYCAQLVIHRQVATASLRHGHQIMPQMADWPRLRLPAGMNFQQGQKICVYIYNRDRLIDA